MVLPLWMLPLCAALLLAGCGSTSNQYDETAGWSAQKIYTEAREEMRAASWDRAIKLLETLEAKYPFGRFAQQAQLDIAYSYWKSNDFASALASVDRFSKLYPNHPNIDYVIYLKGLINFNEDLGLLGKVSRQDPTERDNRAAKDSFDAFKLLVARFPDSKYADDARLRLRFWSTRWRNTKSTWHAITCAAALFWLPQIARSTPSPLTPIHPRRKKPCSSWSEVTTPWGWKNCATTPNACSTRTFRTARSSRTTGRSATTRGGSSGNQTLIPSSSMYSATMLSIDSLAVNPIPSARGVSSFAAQVLTIA